MRTHQVEVDEDIFAFIKSNSEPLVDTFNSTLRRLLQLNSTDSTKPTNLARSQSSTAFPSGTPQALRQILEVAQLVRGGAYTRTSATGFVAKQHKVANQTVQDKYARQLGLTTGQFDRLLEQKDSKELKGLLKSKYAPHAKLIDGTLS